MNKVKIIEQAFEADWSVTYQGKWEVDGEVLEWRYYENSKGTEFWIWDGESWMQPDLDENEAANTIYEICCSEKPDEIEEGEELEWDGME